MNIGRAIEEKTKKAENKEKWKASNNHIISTELKNMSNLTKNMK
jgi:CRISPR/Cas system CMR-associated protein Cmr5 small subunit